LPENIRERVANLSSLFEGEGVLLVYLFGSLATGREGSGDVDLVLLPRTLFRQ